MAQYFMLVNMDKKERVEALKIGGSQKIWEWATGIHGACLVLLCGWTTDRGYESFWKDPDVIEIAGRWAGDRIVLVGDYYESDKDEKKLNLPDWDEIKETYTDISDQLVKAWNKFVEYEEFFLEPYLD